MSKRVVTFANFSVTRLSNNSRLVTSHAGPGWFVLVSYFTPVAAYSRATDKLVVTDTKDPAIATNTTKRHIREFGASMRPGCQEPVSQHQLDCLLAEITGETRLP